MRMIDFRAWDKKESEILDVMDIDFSGNKVGVCNVPKRLFKDGRLHTIHSIERDWSEVELMQYTGLKDKNDTEIFEGDIVRFDARSHYHPEVYAWEYEAKGIGIVRYEMGGYVLGGREEADILESLLGMLMNYEEIEMEVIGNIYEDIELLEEI